MNKAKLEKMGILYIVCLWLGVFVMCIAEWKLIIIIIVYFSIRVTQLLTI